MVDFKHVSVEPQRDRDRYSDAKHPEKSYENGSGVKVHKDQDRHEGQTGKHGVRIYRLVYFPVKEETCGVVEWLEGCRWGVEGPGMRNDCLC